MARDHVADALRHRLEADAQVAEVASEMAHTAPAHMQADVERQAEAMRALATSTAILLGIVQ